MIIMDISELTSLKIEMEKISVKIKDALRKRYPLLEITDEEAMKDKDLISGDKYHGEREERLVEKVNPGASTFDELTVCETFELVEWIRKHAWILEGGNE